MKKIYVLEGGDQRYTHFFNKTDAVSYGEAFRFKTGPFGGNYTIRECDVVESITECETIQKRKGELQKIIDERQKEIDGLNATIRTIDLMAGTRTGSKEKGTD